MCYGIKWQKYIRKLLPCRPGPIVSLPDKTFYSLTQELPMVVGLHRICGDKYYSEWSLDLCCAPLRSSAQWSQEMDPRQSPPFVFIKTAGLTSKYRCHQLTSFCYTQHSSGPQQPAARRRAETEHCPAPANEDSFRWKYIKIYKNMSTLRFLQHSMITKRSVEVPECR